MMSRVLALGAMALSASGTKLYLYNSTNTHGFGFGAYAAEVDYSNGAFSATQVLANFTNTDMISVSGAAACGDYYIAVQTNAPVAAGMAVASLENGTTLQYDTDVLFHALACSPSNPTEVYAVINNPFSANSTEHITFRAITYDFVKQTIVKELGSHTLSTKDPLFQDSGFTFSADRSQLWMINDKSIVTIDLSTGVTAVQSYQDSAFGTWLPYQIEADSIKGSSASGLAYKAKNDEPITEFAYGTFELKGTDASFKLSGKVGDISGVYNGGLPWAFCSSQRVAFVVNRPPLGTAAATLSVFSLPEMGVVAQKALSLADSRQNRLIAALAAKC